VSDQSSDATDIVSCAVAPLLEAPGTAGLLLRVSESWTSDVACTGGTCRALLGAYGQSRDGVTLDDDDIEAVAARVVEMLRGERRARAVAGLVDAATLARILKVDRDWVYAHAHRLGAYRLGEGPKAPLRFDVQRVRENLARRDGRQPLPDEQTPGRRTRSNRSTLPPGVKPIRERSTR
jgi:hypothetical protein